MKEHIKHAEPEDFVAHYEMLRINCNRLVDILKRAAKESCCICNDSCLSCDADKLLREMGIKKFGIEEDETT
jgi:hypothetical protein